MSSKHLRAAVISIPLLSLLHLACRTSPPEAGEYVGAHDGGSTTVGPAMDETSSSTSGGLDTEAMDASMGGTGESTGAIDGTDTSTESGNTTGGVCGDGIVDEGEECDHGGESPACDADCTPAMCGDGTINTTADELCDDGGESPDCDVDCTPAACGDGTFNASHGEQCDTAGLGELCDADCTLVDCGDGVVNEPAGEACDDGGESALCNSDCTLAFCGDGITNATAGEACDDMGPSLVCDGDCTPADCGDLLLNLLAGEQCDGDDLGGATCIGAGFDGGSLACDAACQLDASGCFECGDGSANPGEACDGADLGGATCANLGFDGGTLGCTPGCGHDTSQCYVDPMRCLDIHTIDPAAPSGTYELDVDGPGPLPSFSAYCDMDTDGGGWTELTPAIGCTLGAELVAVDSASIAGIDAECRPFTRDEGDGHTYHYTIPFPAGFSQLMPIDYEARANAGPAYVSDLNSAQFVQTSWDVAYGNAYGDVSFGAAGDAGPAVSFASAGYPSTMCLNCVLVFPGNATIYTLPGQRQALRFGWGEDGGEHEGWYPWWSGTFRVR